MGGWVRCVHEFARESRRLRRACAQANAHALMRTHAYALTRTLAHTRSHMHTPVTVWLRAEVERGLLPVHGAVVRCEVLYEGEWLEILGCGVIHTDVLKNVGMEDRHGWAFGLGE